MTPGGTKPPMFALTGFLAAKTLSTDPARRLDCLQRRSACRPEAWELDSRILGMPEVGRRYQLRFFLLACQSLTIPAKTPLLGRHPDHAPPRKGESYVGLEQRLPSVACLDAIDGLEEPEQGIGHLGEGKLLADADARSATERDVLPSGTWGGQSNAQRPCPRANGGTYPTRRFDSHRSGRNSSASAP